MEGKNLLGGFPHNLHSFGACLVSDSFLCVATVSKISAGFQPHPRHIPGQEQCPAFPSTHAQYGFFGIPVNTWIHFKGHLLEKGDKLLISEEILLHVRGKYWLGRAKCLKASWLLF